MATHHTSHLFAQWLLWTTSCARRVPIVAVAVYIQVAESVGVWVAALSLSVGHGQRQWVLDIGPDARLRCRRIRQGRSVLVMVW